MSHSVVDKILDSPGCATGSAWALLVAMGRRASDDGTGIYESLENLAWRSGVSYKTAQRALDKLLDEKKVIDTGEKKDWGKGIFTCIYRIDISKIVPSQAWLDRVEQKKTNQPVGQSDLSVVPAVGQNDRAVNLTLGQTGEPGMPIDELTGEPCSTRVPVVSVACPTGVPGMPEKVTTNQPVGQNDLSLPKPVGQNDLQGVGQNDRAVNLTVGQIDLQSTTALLAVNAVKAGRAEEHNDSPLRVEEEKANSASSAVVQSAGVPVAIAPDGAPAKAPTTPAPAEPTPASKAPVGALTSNMSQAEKLAIHWYNFQGKNPDHLKFIPDWTKKFENWSSLFPDFDEAMYYWLYLDEWYGDGGEAPNHNLRYESPGDPMAYLEKKLNLPGTKRGSLWNKFLRFRSQSEREGKPLQCLPDVPVPLDVSPAPEVKPKTPVLRPPLPLPPRRDESRDEGVNQSPQNYIVIDTAERLVEVVDADEPMVVMTFELRSFTDGTRAWCCGPKGRRISDREAAELKLSDAPAEAAPPAEACAGAGG